MGRKKHKHLNIIIDRLINEKGFPQNWQHTKEFEEKKAQILVRSSSRIVGKEQNILAVMIIE